MCGFQRNEVFMKAFKNLKKIGFILNVLKVYDEISDYIHDHEVGDRVKDAFDTIKSGIDKLAAIFPDDKFLKDIFIQLFVKKD